MKVLVLAHGTRADVQPYAVLAVTLDQAEHQAVLAAGGLRVARRPVRVQFQPVHGGPKALFDDPSIHEAGARTAVGLVEPVYQLH
jgi:UDP:flavonoid glycosyltransferase YjiC (YdhE family)